VQSAQTLIGGFKRDEISQKNGVKWLEYVGATAIAGVAIFARRGLKSAKLRVHCLPNRERWRTKSARGVICLSSDLKCFSPLICNRRCPSPSSSELCCQFVYLQVAACIVAESGLKKNQDSSFSCRRCRMSRRPLKVLMCQSSAAIRCTLVQGFEMTLDRRGDNTWSSILQSPETPPTPLLTLIFLFPPSLFLDERNVSGAREGLHARRRFPGVDNKSHFFQAAKCISRKSHFHPAKKIHENFLVKKIKILQF
jgi:hypothetical protein